MGLSRDVVEYAVAMILMGTIGIVGFSLYINATTTGGALANADSTTTLVLGTVFILLATLGLALKFMPSELKSKIGLVCVPTQPTFSTPQQRTQAKRIYSESAFEAIG